jgi:(p)ppGpp synthase/HD superfamily hydrolase
MQLILQQLIAIAAKAHEGQVDKAGAPYILHPLRVMLRVDTNEERIVAVLHDVVEDCGWSFERLAAEGFSAEVIEALKALTKREEGEPDYEAFVQRAAANSIAIRVKLADLEDNCNLSRIACPTERDMQRIAKYRRAIEILKAAASARCALCSKLNIAPNADDLGPDPTVVSQPP